MKSNRRSVLIGLGALTVGGGAVFGTGAFSSVEADRTVEVAVAGDSSGLLGLSDEDSDDDPYTEASSVTDGTLELTFDSLGSSSGVNLDAETTFDPLFRIINNGSNPVDVSINNTDPGTVGDGTILSGNVISNTIEDDNSNEVDIEYKFETAGGTAIVDTDTTGNAVNITDGGEEEITLTIGVGSPESGFDASDVDAGEYISGITVLAEDNS